MNKIPVSPLHPPEKASTLDSKLRRLLQNPRRILKKYIAPGMTVLDLGCGTGYFTLEMARLLENKGEVIAIDIQKGMLEILEQKLQNSDLGKKIEVVVGQPSRLGINEPVDFVLAFYAFHEMENLDQIICDLETIMKPEAKILIAEQKFHVSGQIFRAIVEKMTDNGFVVCEQPQIFLSRAVLMQKKSR